MLAFISTFLIFASAFGEEHLHGFGVHSPPATLPPDHLLLKRLAKNPKHDLMKIANEFQILGDLPTLGRDPRYEVSEVTPTEIGNDDVVTVKFRVPKGMPGFMDYIAAYSPADANPTEVVPVKYGWCDRSPDYLKTGEGSLTFNLTNLRSDVKFYYITNGTDVPVIKSSSKQLVSFKNPAEPLRARVVPSGDYDVMWVLWSSSSAVKPQLKWGFSPGVYDHVADARGGAITKDMLCDEPATGKGWRETGAILTADMTGMKAAAAQKVYYIFGDDGNGGGWSNEHVFNAPPLPGQPSAARADGSTGTRVILYDDMGRGTTDQSYTWSEYGRASLWTEQAVGAEVAAGTVDAIYHGGDLSYATGYLAVWDFWLDQISPFAASTIYLTNLGNHESDAPDSATIFKGDDSGGECGVPATGFLPPPAPATTDKPWWGYNVGQIHFVGMSTEHNFTVGSEQWHFLENDLKSVDRSVTPWVIFGGHRAMYINSDYKVGASSDGEVMRLLINNVEPLLLKYNVDVAFWGHNHAVQRQSAVADRKVIQHATAKESFDPTSGDSHTVWTHHNPGAPVHMVIGTAGAGFTVNAEKPGPDWNELTFYEWGYARVEVKSAHELDWTWMNAREGVIKDHMVITKD